MMASHCDGKVAFVAVQFCDIHMCSDLAAFHNAEEVRRALGSGMVCPAGAAKEVAGAGSGLGLGQCRRTVPCVAVRRRHLTIDLYSGQVYVHIVERYGPHLYTSTRHKSVMMVAM